MKTRLPGKRSSLLYSCVKSAHTTHADIFALIQSCIKSEKMRAYTEIDPVVVKESNASTTHTIHVVKICEQTYIYIFSSGVNVYNIDLKHNCKKGSFFFPSLLWCFPTWVFTSCNAIRVYDGRTFDSIMWFKMSFKRTKKIEMLLSSIGNFQYDYGQWMWC